MGGQPGKLLVSVDDKRAQICVLGRASFNCSADFKQLVYRLLETGCRDYTLELAECTIMDSTFLGILVHFARKLPEPQSATPKLILRNPSPRIVDLISSLGMEDYFQVTEGPPLNTTACREIPESNSASKKIESTKIALEAHETLMEANPENVARFKDVTRFLKEDLKRLQE